MKANWSKENLSKIVKESYSKAEVIRKLGLSIAGGSYSQLNRYLIQYELDTSHFTGARWQKSPNFTEEDKKLVKLEDILKENTNYGSDYLKKRLIAAGIKDACCEECGMSEWNGEPIPLELHHINGNHYDNRLENLQILCPNCHAKTPNYRSRNKNKISEIPERIGKCSKIKEKECPICHKIFKPQKNSQKFCSIECAKSNQKQNVKWSKELIEDLCNKYNNMSEIATYLNTSRTTVRNYLERYNLLEQLKEKFDFRAKPILQYDLNGNVIKEWPSISDAEQTLNLTHIGHCCNLQRKSCGGYIWRFKKDSL